MSRMSRDKGKRGELEACEAMKGIWPGLRRTYNQAHVGSGSPDIDAPGCPVHVEVKRAEAINVGAALRQAEEASAGRRPAVVVHRRSREPWLVTMTVETLAGLMDNRFADAFAALTSAEGVTLPDGSRLQGTAVKITPAQTQARDP